MRRAVDDDDVVAGGGAVDFGCRAPAADGGDVEVVADLSAEGLLTGRVPGGEAALRIGVEQLDVPAGAAPGDGQLRRQRRLAGAALLLGNGEDPGSQGAIL